MPEPALPYFITKSQDARWTDAKIGYSNGSEFGPNQVVLGKVLELAQQHAGNEQEFVAAIAREYGWPFATAKNTRLSMRRYLLLDDQDQLTEVGQHLLDLRQIRMNFMLILPGTFFCICVDWRL